jgi:hypothetical protein
MTKLEVIISKHVYTENHERGLRRWVIHVLIALLRLPGLLVASLASLVTLGRIPTLQVRARMLCGLAEYYAGVMRTGSWLSPRAKRNQS